MEYTEKQLSHIDTSFSIKSGQVHHGYKLSVKEDVGYQLIRDFETVTASQHNATIEQIREGDIAAYRDKGYLRPSLPGLNKPSSCSAIFAYNLYQLFTLKKKEVVGEVI